MASGGGGRRQRIVKQGTFTCEVCNISTPYHSFGRNHPFTSSFILLEEAYVARDPFCSTPQPLVLGSHCCSCKKTVCVSSSCSVFYCKRFCVDCVRANPGEFPSQILQEVDRQTQ